MLSGPFFLSIICSIKTYLKIEDIVRKQLDKKRLYKYIISVTGFYL